MQKLYIIGNLVSDPEVRSTPNGITVTSFTLAVDRKFKDQSGEKKTDFFKCQAWRQLGETVARYLSKGKKCAVIGELQPRLYDAKDGTTRLSLDVQVDECEFLSPRTDAEKHDEPKEEVADMQGFTEIDTSDLPF